MRKATNKHDLIILSHMFFDFRWKFTIAIISPYKNFRKQGTFFLNWHHIVNMSSFIKCQLKFKVKIVVVLLYLTLSSSTSSFSMRRVHKYDSKGLCIWNLLGFSLSLGAYVSTFLFSNFICLKISRWSLKAFEEGLSTAKHNRESQRTLFCFGIRL